MDYAKRSNDSHNDKLHLRGEPFDMGGAEVLLKKKTSTTSEAKKNRKKSLEYTTLPNLWH